MVKRFHSNSYLVSDINRTADFYRKAGFGVEVSDGVAKAYLGDFTLVLMDENKVEISNEAGTQPKGLGIYTYVAGSE